MSDTTYSAMSILKATGLDEELGNRLSGNKSTEFAEQVIIIDQDVTHSTDLTTVVDVVQFDDAMFIEVKKALVDQMIPPNGSTYL